MKFFQVKITRLLLLIFLFLGFSCLAQKKPALGAFDKATSIFKNFEKELFFLNEQLSDIDSLQTIFNDPKLKNKPGFLQDYEKSLQQITNSFTDYNVKHLVAISDRLKSIHPIRGSEITYLNKSFRVFSSYQNLYKYLIKKTRNFKQEIQNNPSDIFILHLQLGQINLFYKNYFSTIENTRIRRILNADDATYNKKDNDFKRLVVRVLSKNNYKAIQKQIRLTSGDIINTPQQDSVIYQYIKNHPYKNSRIKEHKKQLKRYFRKDNSYKLGQFFMQQISGAIGNFMGIFRFRKGYLYKNDSLLTKISKHLEPMDILAEKTGFALTDKLIPGHFGHIALWLGTQEQLENAGLWDHPAIQPFQNRIKMGYCILETDREGTHLKRLKKFMNVDELVIARIKEFSGLAVSEKILVYQNALAQLGKKYDFNFDVETSDKLVCSELLYQVFGTVHWPTDRVLKRATISPDNVLSLLLYKNSPIELSYYITACNKQKVHHNDKETLASNLGFVKKEDAYYYPEKKCERKYVKGRERKKKVCKTIYQTLIYK